jgi:hypothetical protein
MAVDSTDSLMDAVKKFFFFLRGGALSSLELGRQDVGFPLKAPRETLLSFYLQP